MVVKNTRGGWSEMFRDSRRCFAAETLRFDKLCAHQFRGSILARRTANFADPTCQFWLVFAGSPFRIFKKVRIILRPKFTNLNFRLPTIYINRLTRKNLKPCGRHHSKTGFKNASVDPIFNLKLVQFPVFMLLALVKIMLRAQKIVETSTL